MPTLLVLGGSGLVGSKLAASARKDFRVIATHRTNAPRIEGVEWMEVHKERIETATSAIARSAPDCIVDTAALHDVDRCEEDRERAWQVNAASTGSLAAAAAARGARYVFISTDFVFDGERGLYREADPPAPVNYYGETKLAGERAVIAADAGHQVVRPSVVYGWDATRLNFATWLLTSLRDRKDVQIVTDWIGSPTWADSLADSILRLLRVSAGGIYHLAGPDRLSRFEFALRLAAAYGLETSRIKPVTAAQFARKARRPRDSSLVNSRAAQDGIVLPSVEESLRRMRAQQDLESFVTPTRFKS